MQQHKTTPQGDRREDISYYPEFPRIEQDPRRVTVSFNGEVIADSTSSHRVLEMGRPPAFYIPPEDVRIEHLNARQEQTWCEHKGDAHYYDISVGDRTAERAAWTYPEPKEAFREVQHGIAFYPGRVDSCTVNGEEVQVVDGDDSGGWITSEITGQFNSASDT